MKLFSQVPFVQNLYGPPLVPLYGPPIDPFSQILNYLPQILLIATIPIALIIGLVLYFKKKKDSTKKNAKRNS